MYRTRNTARIASSTGGEYIVPLKLEGAKLPLYKLAI